jgi:capsular exopolysaccharide synthesis family protein
MLEKELPSETSSQSLARLGHQELIGQTVVDVSPEEVPHLLDYWHIVLKRRWTVLATLIVVFVTVAISTLKQEPVYQGNVLIEIDPEQPNVFSFKEVLQVQSVDIASYRETQYRVITSRSLAENVVKELELWRLPEFYRGKLLFGSISRNPDRLPSPDDRTPDVDADYFRNSVASFLNAVDVSPVRYSNLIALSFSSHDPELAYKAANKLAYLYIQKNLSTKAQQNQLASDWLQGQLADLKVKLEKAEEDLQTYAKRNSILFLSETKEEKKSLVQERLTELQEAYTKAQSERFKRESLYKLVQEGRVQDLPGFLENKMIQDLNVRLAEAERDYARVLAKYKPDYPEALALKKQVDAVQVQIDHQKKILEQNIVDEYQAAVAYEKLQGDALDVQKQVANDIAQRSIAYNILKRDVDTYRSLYEGLMQRSKESAVAALSKASNIFIVDAAELPKYPVKPRLLFNLTVGLMLGAGLGIGFAFLQEYLDNTLKTSDEVETLLRLPSLGVLPTFSLNGASQAKTAEDEDKLAVIPDRAAETAVPAIQTDPIAVEAFRSLRTSILLSANPVPKMLLITSALPGEGKTAVTVNLGATLASLGSKVLILDCDMRRPACHRATGVENKPGFVQCLTGHVELADAILPVPNVANLRIIPCGPIPPNPAEVLSSAVTADLLRRLRDQFEYVLVDSPPLLSVSDSRILSTLTDAVVLVVRAFSTPYDVVRRARALLYGASARILGVALNDVDIERGGYGYDSYRYGYGVGYGYGPASKEDSEHP